MNALTLAKELHKFYRAAFKALPSYPGFFAAGCNVCIQPRGVNHDHGWSNCHKQKYFIKRAEQILAAMSLESEPCGRAHVIFTSETGINPVIGEVR